MTIRIDCTFKRKFYQNRYIFMDKDGLYFFWQLDFSEYGLDIDIITLKQDKNDFKIIKSSKEILLIEYLKEILTNQNSAFISTFFKNINFFEFKIEKKYIETFGEKFCHIFLCQRDREFILRDKYAKHLIIDFDKIKRREPLFFYQPDIFPLYISEVGVNITKDAKIFKNSQEIQLNEFWKMYDNYMQNLKKVIQKKDRIFFSIEKDLKNRFLKTLKQLESEKITDFEIDAYIEVFDDFLSDYILGKVLFCKKSFEDKELYSQGIYGLDIKISNIMWYVIDRFGIDIVNKKLYFWSEIEIKNQKFFHI